MSDFNKVLLMGNLTRDPQQRSLPSGMSVATFGMAMNHRYRTPQGEDRDETCFVEVDCFARQADNVVRYLHKGSQVLVEGRLRYDQWVDRQTGQNRARLKVVADSVQFIDRAGATQPPVAGDAYAQAGFGGPAAAPAGSAPMPQSYNRGGYGQPAGFPAQNGGSPSYGGGMNLPPPPPFEPLPKMPAPGTSAPMPPPPAPAENGPAPAAGAADTAEDIPF